jgi:homoserine O-acetyltransferase
MDDVEIFEAGDVRLQSGITLRDAKLVYKTHGTLSADRRNAIIYPTRFSGRHGDNEFLIGDGMALDPGRYFIIVPNLLGNGISSSPSNTPPPFDQARFPHITIYDNVRLQHRLLSERYGIDSLALAVGWSMGAQQAYHWGALYPDMVARVAAICGSAKTAPHNFVFLEGIKAALTADAAWHDGWYKTPPTKGLRAAARAWAAWACPQAFFREELYRDMGYSSIEDFLVGYWEGMFLQREANNLLALIWSWQNADISANELYDGDFPRALGAIKARTIVMPGETDLYFPPEDNAIEVGHMPNAELRTIPSIWGHYAGGGKNDADTAFIDDALKELLAS